MYTRTHTCACAPTVQRRPATALGVRVGEKARGVIFGASSTKTELGVRQLGSALKLSQRTGRSRQVRGPRGVLAQALGSAGQPRGRRHTYQQGRVAGDPHPVDQRLLLQEAEGAPGRRVQPQRLLEHLAGPQSREGAQGTLTGPGVTTPPFHPSWQNGKPRQGRRAGSASLSPVPHTTAEPGSCGVRGVRTLGRARELPQA